MRRRHWLFRAPYPDAGDWLALALGMAVCAFGVLAWAALR